MVTIYDFDKRQIAEILPKDTSYVFKQIMGEQYLMLEFTTAEFITLNPYCYIDFENERYFLQTDATITKASETQYDYSCKFVAVQGLMSNVLMKYNETALGGEESYTTNPFKFSLTATAENHIAMLCKSLDRLNICAEEWSAGELVENGLYKTITYDYMTCADALNAIADAYNTEWYITGSPATGYRINLTEYSRNADSPLPIQYGKHKGVLPNVKRSMHSQSDKVTHIVVQGGDRNILHVSEENNRSKYPFPSLHLPKLSPEDENDTEGETRMAEISCANLSDATQPANPRWKWDNPWIDKDSSYIRNALKDTILFDVRSGKFQDEYEEGAMNNRGQVVNTRFQIGTSLRFKVNRSENTVCWIRNDKEFNNSVAREKSVDLSDIYPQREGTVTAELYDDDKGVCTFTDSSIPEDLNYREYYISSETMSIVFQTGMLAGKEFKIATNDKGVLEGYNHDERSFRLVSEDFDGITMPNENWKPKAGDKYIVFGCALPDAYLSSVRNENVNVFGSPYNFFIYEGAEWDLLRQACIECYRSKKNRYNYDIKIDNNWLLEESERIERMRLGEWVEFKDGYLVDNKPVTSSHLGNYYDTWNNMRIVGIKKYLNKPLFPEITLGEPAPKGILAKVREIQSGTASSQMAVQGVKEETEKKIEQTKQETSQKVEQVVQQVQVIETITSNGDGSSSKIPIIFQGLRISPIITRGGRQNTITKVTIAVNSSLGLGTNVLCSHLTMMQDTLTTWSNILTRPLVRWRARVWNYYIYGFSSSTSDGSRPRTYTPNTPFYIYVVLDPNTSLETEGAFDFIGNYGRQFDSAYLSRYTNEGKTVYLIAKYIAETEELTTYYGRETINPAKMPTSRIESSDGGTVFDISRNKIVSDNYKGVVENEEMDMEVTSPISLDYILGLF